MGFKQAPCDPCLYIHSDSEGETFVVGVYVGDIILGGGSIDNELNEKFKMKDLGSLHHFLGVKIIQDQSTGVTWIGQPSYMEKILQK